MRYYSILMGVMLVGCGGKEFNPPEVITDSTFNVEMSNIKKVDSELVIIKTASKATLSKADSLLKSIENNNQ